MKLFKVLPVFSILCIIMGGCSLSIGGYPLLPSLALVPVYYWLVYRPDWIPVWSLFLIGLFYDALLGNELGISSILLMSSSFLGQYVRPSLNPHLFHLIWGGFIIYSAGYLVLYALLTFGGFPLLVSWGYGIILYPLLAWALSHLHTWVQSHA